MNCTERARTGAENTRRAAAKRSRSARRCLYAATCLISSGVILWALIRMALASPLYALAALAGMLILMLARLDILLGALDPNSSPRSASRAHTGTMH